MKTASAIFTISGIFGIIIGSCAHFPQLTWVSLGALFLALVFILIARHKASKKKLVVETPAEEPKPFKRQNIMSLTVVTPEGQKFDYASENDFGLDWELNPKSPAGSIIYLSVRQMNSIRAYGSEDDSNEKWHVVAQIKDGSVVNVKWEDKEFPADTPVPPKKKEQK